MSLRMLAFHAHTVPLMGTGWQPHTKTRRESKPCSFSLSYIFFFNWQPLLSDLTHTSYWPKWLTWFPEATSSAGKCSIWFLSMSGCSLAMLLPPQSPFFYLEQSLYLFRKSLHLFTTELFHDDVPEPRGPHPWGKAHTDGSLFLRCHSPLLFIGRYC